MSTTFKRHKEDFECSNCQYYVHGNGLTDHCPRCLYSRHVDITPGDRAAACQGMMKPIDIAPNRSGYKIFYECLTCGYKHSNKSVEDDQITLFIESLEAHK